MKSKKQEGFDYQNFEKEALKALYEGKPLEEALGPLLKRIVEAGLQGQLQSVHYRNGGYHPGRRLSFWCHRGKSE